jgi:ribosomal protein S18 acetylase RimI-like enzyme
MFDIAPYADTLHRREVVDLWRAVFGYEAAHNAPPLAIDRKCAVDDGLFFVALDGASAVVGTVMAGYDGHRGWLYAIAVHPAHRQRGLGTALVRHAEQALTVLGCVKINLQLADGNAAVAGFYQRLGYAVEPRTSMGKVIGANVRQAGADGHARGGLISSGSSPTSP